MVLCSQFAALLSTLIRTHVSPLRHVMLSPTGCCSSLTTVTDSHILCSGLYAYG
ncbi:hypothetical protein PF005_g6272 [Phytophthora fragariae]|uniref:Uncharacterized protein n=1 Tax=Phytophthora fragariae TaxID=53985 RepID=A0A6A3YSI4_9STRA|nr:hypothetical protein PF003_g32433 [Phytophthora fragariae]KAE8947031.1 hypothetical protein PF009_g3345 [Phytophthora fragariae]KAE9123378.1 hypothetical protein PF007_g7073 [Phytophthora fragariae]KAE9152011.1 hypothetical protein PF006_g3739 [Phytophthora fragariae]KAE9223510.1 hypothetical protein PF005_g6272 [Phytophthora fragariae]